jgi:hypothetical protein
MRRKRSRLKDLIREDRITVKDYTLFSMETKEIETEIKEEKFHGFHL